MTLFECFDADPLPLAQDSERGYEAMVDDSSLQIVCRLRSCPEVGIPQQLTHHIAIRSSVTTFQ